MRMKLSVEDICKKTNFTDISEIRALRNEGLMFPREE